MPYALRQLHAVRVTANGHNAQQQNVVLHGEWRSATQLTQSDGEAYTGTGGLRPPLQSAQLSSGKGKCVLWDGRTLTFHGSLYINVDKIAAQAMYPNQDFCSLSWVNLQCFIGFFVRELGRTGDGRT